jgi:hypothetical protein
LILLSGISLLGCTEDQSKKIGDIPKQTVNKVTVDVNKAMQQGAANTAKADEKENK